MNLGFVYCYAKMFKRVLRKNDDNPRISHWVSPPVVLTLVILLLIISSSVYPVVIISHQQQNEKMLLFFRQALAQSQEQRQNSSSGRVDSPLTNVVAKQTNNIVGLRAYYDISFRIGTAAAIKSIEMQFPADTNVSIPGPIGTDVH